MDWIWNCKANAMTFSKTGNVFLLSRSPWSCGLHVWDNWTQATTCFLLCYNRLKKNDVAHKDVQHLTALIRAHLVALSDNFNHYFPCERYDILSFKRWIQNPFDFKSSESSLESGLTPVEETELLQLSSYCTLKRRHELMTSSSFWSQHFIWIFCPK